MILFFIFHYFFGMQCFTAQISFLKTDYEIFRGFHALRIELVLFDPADLTILAFFHAEAPMNPSQVITQSKITWPQRVSCKLGAGFSKAHWKIKKSIIGRIGILLAEFKKFLQHWSSHILLCSSRLDSPLSVILVFISPTASLLRK